MCAKCAERNEMPNKKQLYDKQNRYNRSQYDRISVVVPKGERERLQAIAKAQGTSLNGLITIAVSEYTGVSVQNVQKKRG